MAITKTGRTGAAKLRRIAGRSDAAAAALMTLPALTGLVLFVVIPFGLAIWLSLNYLNLQSIASARWVGLHQYALLFTDPDVRGAFYRSLLNNAVFALVVVPLQTGLALVLATLLNRRMRGIAVFRTLFFMPVVFPMALVAVVWKLIYAPDQLGMLNSIVRAVSSGHIGPVDWLGNPRTALPAIMIMSIWQGVGLQMVIILAGLQGINPELYEAAAVDGASPWQQFRAVTLPGLRNTLIFVITVTTILAFQLFDQIYILTQGGPSNATTTVMYQAVTDTISEGDVGQGSAVTVVFFAVVLAITLLQRRFLREERAVQ